MSEDGSLSLIVHAELPPTSINDYPLGDVFDTGEFDWLSTLYWTYFPNRMPAMWFDNYCLKDIGIDNLENFGTKADDLDLPNPAGENDLDIGSLSDTFTCWTEGLYAHELETSSQTFKNDSQPLSFITTKFGGRVTSLLNKMGYGYSIHSMEAQDDLLVINWSLANPNRSVITTFRMKQNSYGNNVLIIQSPMLKGTTSIASENPWALNFRIPLIFQSALFMAERPNRDPMMWAYRTSAFPGLDEELLPEPFLSTNSPAHVPVARNNQLFGVDCGIGISLGYLVDESISQSNLNTVITRCVSSLVAVHEVLCDVFDNAGMSSFYEGVGLRGSFDVMYPGDLFPVWWDGA